MRLRLVVTLVLALALVAMLVGPAAACPTPGKGFGAHVSCMAKSEECKAMATEMSGNFGLHVKAMAQGTCTCEHMGDGMNGGMGHCPCCDAH